ncbi:MAG: DUF4032 domain-containing protein [Actinomycetota bacterium]
MVALQLRTSEIAVAELLDLPWSTPIDDWPEDITVRLPRGTHRHPVCFVERSGVYLALKELPERLVRREFELLSHLMEEGLPTVDVVGTALSRRGAGDERLEGVIITRHLSYSLPYRSLFRGPIVPDVRQRLIDALAVLLVRLHLGGFFWGDCSLNNALFRRDAGALAAFVVDVETGELHEELTDGQRTYELDIAAENIAGGLFDLVAAGRIDEDDLDPFEVVESLRQRYADLWAELTHVDEVGGDELYRINERLRRVNELGFDTAEVEVKETGGERRFRFRPVVVEEGHHKRQLLQLTGIEVEQENQARRLLNAIRSFGAWLSEQEGRDLPEGVVAYRWLTERWDMTMASIPTELAGRLEPAEIYHQVLEHNWFLSEQAGKDIGLDTAVDSYIEAVLRHQPDERMVIDQPTAVLDLSDLADVEDDTT